MMALAVRGIGRTVSGQTVEFLEAANGDRGIALARRHSPQVVVADEIASRAGAFALARELKGSAPPFPGRIVILLDRRQDVWLAAWSGADAWFVKPVNPFELAETVASLAHADPATSTDAPREAM